MDRYTCEQAFRDMDAYLDREVGVAETGRVVAHLDGCAGCAKLFRLEAAFLSAIRTRLKRVPVPPAQSTWSRRRRSRHSLWQVAVDQGLVSRPTAPEAS